MEIAMEQLRRLAPGADGEILRGLMNTAIELPDLGIDGPRRLRHFMAQCAAETGGFRSMTESLTYSSAERLMAVWPSRFPAAAAASPFVRNPRGLAERVYGGRMGNGPEGSGDGWRFMGRGIKMLTGRDNYTRAGVALRLPLVERPETAGTFPAALHIACWYWRDRNVGPLADRDDLEAVTRAINGGLIGLADRRLYLERAREIWADAAFGGAGAGPRDLRQGHRGDDVAALQRAINDVAAYRPPLVVDGDFGPVTAEAVTFIQTINRLPGTGIADAATRAALMMGE